MSLLIEGFGAIAVGRQKARHRCAHFRVVVDDRYNLLTVCHDIPELHTYRQRFGPRRGAEVPSGCEIFDADRCPRGLA